MILVACGRGENGSSAAGSGAGSPGGTIVISTGGDPDGLFPPLVASTAGQQVTELVYDRLADVGSAMNTVGDSGFQPQLAESWTWSPDSLSVTFHLDPRAKWHDGLPVRASDVAFTYALYTDTATASPSAPLIATIDSVTTPDSLTAVFWFSKRSPMQFYEATNPMLIIPAHALEGIRGKGLRTAPLARAPIGSGRYRFVSWNPGSSIEITADTGNYRGRPHANRIIWSIAPDPNTALTRLLGGEADVFEALTAASLPQMAGHREVRTVMTPGLDYNFIQFNLRDPAHPARPHPLFGDRALRRALTMAVDRTHIVQNVYDSLAAVSVGPTVRAYPSTDTTLHQIPFSLDGARQLLDSLGWRGSADGIRRRNGRPLEFSLSVPSSSKNRMGMAVIIQDQLKQAGANMKIDKLEIASFIDREKHHSFDAVFGGWHVDASPGGIRQTWGSRGSHAAGGSNYGSYENAAFDAAADSALSAMDLGARRRLFKVAYQMIIDDAPAIWLAEPRNILAISSRIRTPSLRSDSWWANMAEWWVPPSERIARDRIGLSQ